MTSMCQSVLVAPAQQPCGEQQHGERDGKRDVYLRLPTEVASDDVGDGVRRRADADPDEADRQSVRPGGNRGESGRAPEAKFAPTIMEKATAAAGAMCLTDWKNTSRRPIASRTSPRSSGGVDGCVPRAGWARSVPSQPPSARLIRLSAQGRPVPQPLAEPSKVG